MELLSHTEKIALGLEITERLDNLRTVFSSHNEDYPLLYMVDMKLYNEIGPQEYHLLIKELINDLMSEVSILDAMWNKIHKSVKIIDENLQPDNDLIKLIYE